MISKSEKPWIPPGLCRDSENGFGCRPQLCLQRNNNPNLSTIIKTIRQGPRVRLRKPAAFDRTNCLPADNYYFIKWLQIVTTHFRLVVEILANHIYIGNDEWKLESLGHNFANRITPKYLTAEDNEKLKQLNGTVSGGIWVEGKSGVL